jgi:hypothetical protein
VGGFRLFENSAHQTGLHSIQFTLKGGAQSNSEAFGAVMWPDGRRQVARDLPAEGQ